MSAVARPSTKIFAGAEDKSFINTIRFVSWVVFCLPPLLILTLINQYCVNIPLKDQWSEIPFYVKAVHHTLSLNDLLAFHNEHRMVVSKLFLAITAWNGWDTVLECRVSVVFALVALACVAGLLFDKKSKWSLVSIPFASLLMFSTNQAENWTWGFQMAWFIALACVCGAVLALEKMTDQKWAMVTATFLSVAATYCIGSAVFIGFALCGYLILRKDKWKHSWMVMLGVTLLSLALYKVGYHPELNAYKAPGSAINGLGFALSHLLTALGKPFASPAILFKSADQNNALWSVAGLGLTVASWWVGLKQNRAVFLKKAAPWMVFMVFSVPFIVMAIYGRIDTVQQFGIVPRYIVFLNLFWLGVVGTGIAAAQIDHRMRWATLGLVGAMAIRLVLIHPLGQKIFVAQGDISLVGTQAMTAPCDSKQLLPLHANHAEIVNGCFMMADNRIGVFANAKK